jgi:hypothetical protein
MSTFLPRTWPFLPRTSAFLPRTRAFHSRTPAFQREIIWLHCLPALLKVARQQPNWAGSGVINKTYAKQP